MSLPWSGRRGSNSLPPPWQGGALPDELCPQIGKVSDLLAIPSIYINQMNSQTGFHSTKQTEERPQLSGVGVVLALPIFPGRHQPSIVGRNELNYRVRNGNGWTLTLISTNFVSASSISCAFAFRQKLALSAALPLPLRPAVAGL